jgi:hypothetical protein
MRSAHLLASLARAFGCGLAMLVVANCPAQDHNVASVPGAQLRLQRQEPRSRIDLSGSWGFQFDGADFEMAFENAGAHRDKLLDRIKLPGTTDSSGKGIATTGRPINRLSRRYEFSGPAWYRKEVEIPRSWEGKSIELVLERVLWISTLYVDGTRVGSIRSFSTPHAYDLTALLSSGKHVVTICVDNRVPQSFDRWSHAFSEYTQTAWNGIVGDIHLQARDPIHVVETQVHPDVPNQSARIVCSIANPEGGKVEGVMRLSAKTVNAAQFHEVAPQWVPFSGTGKIIEFSAMLPMGEAVRLWDEFSPVVYEMEASLSARAGSMGYSDTSRVRFGMRQYAQNGAHFAVNGRPVFLRGTLECAIFPLTGYPDMSVAGWRRICETVKAYGLNHVRFHSWCPPEAAFAAADQAGVYLQVELPCWTEVGKDEQLNTFLQDEMDAILRCYGNHPSFVQICMGNELRGDFDYLARLVKRGKERDPRHFYSGSTARTHLPEDQFYVSHQSGAGGMTTYGARGPQTDYDLHAAYDVLKVPGMAHEVGQRAVYPNFDEIKKYTGVLYPRNFEVFRETLQAHGMLDQAGDFFHVSGRMTAMLYKESIEALLRTANCGGFQLLDLHDFPGQGTALVGILDPFWDSKGIIAPEKFREFCGPTVPLLRLKKRTYFSDETLIASAELYHYGAAPLENLEASWNLRTRSNQGIASGRFEKKTIPIGTLASLGQISVPLSGAGPAQTLTVTIEAGAFRNSWDIWVYPRDLPETKADEPVVARTADQALAVLDRGGRVLLLPDVKQLEGKKAEFQNHFWCPIMFRWEPMSMGTLVKHRHPVFRDFATEFYTDWQWWDIVSNSRVLDLDGTVDGFRPLVQIIDAYDRCLKEGILFEARVGKGRLLMAAIDFERNIAQRPAARQLLYSLKNYAASPAFRPVSTLTADRLKGIFKKPSLLTGAKLILADSYETGNEPELAIDDNPATLWHTAYSSPGTFAVTSKQPETDYPHELQIELAGETEFAGFSYVPRQDGVNGYVARYEFYASNDKSNWGEPVARGTFARDAKVKSVPFDKAVKARYIRFVALKGFDGQKWASIAELKLIPSK